MKLEYDICRPFAHVDGTAAWWQSKLRGLHSLLVMRKRLGVSIASRMFDVEDSSV